MSKMKFAGLVGSLRKGAHSATVMRTLQELAPEGTEIEVLEIGHLPHYDEDLKADGSPQAVLDFAAGLRAADGVVIVTPEYNRSMPGVLKNALDWVSKEPEPPFADKPVAIISQSPGALGGILANYHLRQVLSVMRADFLTGGEVAINGVAGKMADGTITDEGTRKVLTRDLERLAQMVRVVELTRGA